MKKIFATTVLMGLFCAALFAEGFTVKKLVGKVSCESAPGVWTKLKKGDRITGDTVIDVSLHSQIEITGEDGKLYTIKAMKKGKVASFVTKTSGLKKSSTSTGSTVAGDTGAGKTISTSSSRASDAQEDLIWSDE